MNASGPTDRRHDDDTQSDGGHHHPTGIKGFLHGLLVPHSHDVSDSIDDALEASSQGIRAVKISLIGLGATAILQLVVVLVSGSVALLADTIHNFSDALTAIPLWIAFILGRRKPTRTYPYGFGRVEDLAGLFIVAMIALSAILAGYESIRRLIDPQPLNNLGWVLAAGVIGFMGNEAVAVYRIRTGRRIGSAALVADGIHARTDGFTSLAVVFGAVGVMLGFPLADPIVGLIITVAIAVLLWGTARDVCRRLLDGIDPQLATRAETALDAVASLLGEPPGIRLRWTGHRLNADLTLAVSPDMNLTEFHLLATGAERSLRQALPVIGQVNVIPVMEATR